MLFMIKIQVNSRRQLIIQFFFENFQRKFVKPTFHREIICTTHLFPS